MRIYLLLRERAVAYRADPEVQAALAASRVAELSSRRSAPARPRADLLADTSAFEDFDADARGGSWGTASSVLDQLAVEHCSADASARKR